MDDFRSALNRPSDDAQHWAPTPGLARSAAAMAVPIGAALGGGLLAGNSAPTPPAGVPNAYGMLELSITAISSQIGELHERLDRAGVLKPMPPTGQPSGAQQGPPFQTSLANAMALQAQRLQNYANALAELRDRIDL